MQQETTTTTGKITCNVHRLSFPEIGFEASTRHLKSPLGRYYVASGATEAEAINGLAHEVSVPMSALTVEFRG